MLGESGRKQVVATLVNVEGRHRVTFSDATANAVRAWRETYERFYSSADQGAN